MHWPRCLISPQFVNIPIVPSPPPQKKKNTIGIWVSIAKEPFMESENQTGFYSKTPSDLAKYIVTKKYGFWKASHRSPPSKFCHLTVCGFHRGIVQHIQCYAYLSNIGCSLQPKSLSDMWNHVNNTFHKDQGQ